jgi:4'-phosphopantetheinyl transferase EntD
VDIVDFESPARPHERNGSGLHDDELAFAQLLAAGHRAGFVAGRRALRAAVQQLSPGAAVPPMLRTDRGAPQLPSGLTGSISHKRERAIALAAPSTGGLVGLDLEQRPGEADLARPSIAPRILTAIEQARLSHLDAMMHREQTLVHFAIKEAVYKAIDPWVQRYVRFAEVELDVESNGLAHVHLRLPEPVMRGVHVDARWRFEGRWIVAMAHSSRIR